MKLKTLAHIKRLRNVGVNLLYIQVKSQVKLNHIAQLGNFILFAKFQCFNVQILSYNKYGIVYMEKSRKREMARK